MTNEKNSFVDRTKICLYGKSTKRRERGRYKKVYDDEQRILQKVNLLSRHLGYFYLQMNRNTEHITQQAVLTFFELGYGRLQTSQIL